MLKTGLAGREFGNRNLMDSRKITEGFLHKTPLILRLLENALLKLLKLLFKSFFSLTLFLIIS